MTKIIVSSSQFSRFLRELPPPANEEYYDFVFKKDVLTVGHMGIDCYCRGSASYEVPLDSITSLLFILTKLCDQPITVGFADTGKIHITEAVVG